MKLISKTVRRYVKNPYRFNLKYRNLKLILTLEDVKTIKTECEKCSIIKLICCQKHFKETMSNLPPDKYAALSRIGKYHASFLTGLNFQSAQKSCSLCWLLTGYLHLC